MDELTSQELADELQNINAKQIQLLRMAKKVACDAAAKDPALGEVVAEVSLALGHAEMIHAHQTRAAGLMPDTAPRFGGK